jgi:hypothetical protein
MKTSYHITVDGIVSTVSPENGTDFKLPEVQKLVEGHIEIVHLGNEEIMIVNDCGKFDKELNTLATLLARSKGALYQNDYICGDVVVCPSEMLR